MLFRSKAKAFLLLALLSSLIACQNKNSVKEHSHQDTKAKSPDLLKAEASAKAKAKAKKDLLAKTCSEQLLSIPGKISKAEVESICKRALTLKSCKSVEGSPIFHFDRVSSEKKSRNILVFALIHGDEAPSGTVARSWISRLASIDPRSSWRVVPVLNPDGYKLKTRMNANRIDLNRNFPTKSWKKQSKKRWIRKKRDPRRFPGTIAGSEPEVKCAMEHLDSFKPDFIISIHTPYGVLDFDGPRMNFPKFEPLPWISLGNYPGSLGRFMWKERKVPVLTIELKGNEIGRLVEFDNLQDISGAVAIQSQRILVRKKKAAKRKKVKSGYRKNYKRRSKRIARKTP